MCRCAVAWANSARCAVHIVVLARLAVHFIVSARCCASHIIVSELHIYTFLCHRCAARIVMPARCTVHAKVVLQTREDIRKTTDPRRRPFRRRHDQSQSDLDLSAYTDIREVGIGGRPFLRVKPPPGPAHASHERGGGGRGIS